jgi:NAD(P)-dependent dehydrogenase (short-subunit alcohol dehydrogenase family)
VVGVEARRILVVGASTGIGRQVVIAAARTGGHVVASGRALEPLLETCADAGPGAHAVACDIRHEAECEKAVSEAVAILGGLDAIVVAAGITDFQTVASADAAAWRNLVDTNVVGPALVARAALPHLVETAGRILFLSSIAARRPPPGLVPYAVTKAALEALAAGLQDEQPDIDVSCIVLGPTATAVTDGWDRTMLAERFKEWRDGRYLTSGAMQTEDVADYILAMLASPFRIPITVAVPVPKRREARKQ